MNKQSNKNIDNNNKKKYTVEDLASKFNTKEYSKKKKRKKKC